MFVPDTIIVAAVQSHPKILEIDTNLAHSVQLAFEAAAKGSAVIVLPELCISGFTIRNKNEAALAAQEQHGYQTQAFMEIASRFNCHIVFGYIEVYENNLYNSAAIVGPTGLVSNTRKHNLYGSDNLWATPGEELCPIVLTRAGRLGVLICRDAMNKYRDSYEFKVDGQQFYKKGSVDTIALLTNWSGDYSFPDTTWIELVESLDCNLIVSNRVGVDRDIKFKGGSCVIDRNRYVWTHGSNFETEAVVGGIVLL